MLPEDDRVIETCRGVLSVLMYILDFLNNIIIYIYIYIYIYVCVCVCVCMCWCVKLNLPLCFCIHNLKCVLPTIQNG